MCSESFLSEIICKRFNITLFLVYISNRYEKHSFTSWWSWIWQRKEFFPCFSWLWQNWSGTARLLRASLPLGLARWVTAVKVFMVKQQKDNYLHLFAGIKAVVYTLNWCLLLILEMANGKEPITESTISVRSCSQYFLKKKSSGRNSHQNKISTRRTSKHTTM